MTYTNPINPKMQVTLNAYTRKRKQIVKDLQLQYEVPSPEFFAQVKHVVSKFYVDLGYTTGQCDQMNKDAIDELISKL